MKSSFEEIVEHAVLLRHELHRHPERTWHEEATAERIRGELTRLGLKWQACAKTGTVADLGPSHGARVALRADIDALPIEEATDVAYKSRHPGSMHACGHDGHTASLLATAAWLTAHQAELPVGVRLIFQPAEEGGHGAKAMIEAGCLEGVGSVFGYHNLPTIPSGKAAVPDGTVLVSNGHFEITIRGKGGHASTPEACRDPLLAGAQFVAAVQQIIARNVAPQTAAVVTVSTFHGGTARNVIPASVVLGGTIRAAETELRQQLAARVEEVLRGVCLAAGVEGDFEFQADYPATVNEPRSAATLREACDAELGDDWQQSTGIPFMGAEDFSYYLQRIPGAYALLGSGRPGHEHPLHSPHFDFDDALIPLAVRLWSRVVGAPLPPSAL